LNLDLSADEVIDNRPVMTQSEADLLAQSTLNEKCQAFFRAEGTCRGNPAIRAGRQVKIEGIGIRFAGTYLITRAVHRYDLSGYTTRFEISGYRADTLKQLIGSLETTYPYGVVVGLVTDVNDPEGLARVKVKYPTMPTIPEEIGSNWARLATPMAGKERGIEFIPEINDEVLIAFEHNDINKPYIIGSLWNGQDKPPHGSEKVVNSGSGAVDKRIIKSRSGHVITFDDTESAEKISIVDKNGQKIVMDNASGAGTIEVIDKTGNKIFLSKDGIAFESAKDLIIKATGKIQIDAQTGITIKSAAGNLELEAMAKASLKGMTTSVTADGMGEVKANGPLTVKGALVQIN
jgi:phage baseplate assembly protein gpV